MSRLRVLTAALVAGTMLVTAHVASADPFVPTLAPAPQLWIGQGSHETELPFVGGCRATTDANGLNGSVCADPAGGLGPTLMLSPDRGGLTLRFSDPVSNVWVNVGSATVPPATRVDDTHWTVPAGAWISTTGNLSVSARDAAGEALYAGVVVADPSPTWPGAGYKLRSARIAKGTLAARVSLTRKVTVALSLRLDGRRRARMAATLPAGTHTLRLHFPRTLTAAARQRGRLAVSYRRHGREISSLRRPFTSFSRAPTSDGPPRRRGRRSVRPPEDAAANRRHSWRHPVRG